MSFVYAMAMRTNAITVMMLNSVIGIMVMHMVSFSRRVAETSTIVRSIRWAVGFRHGVDGVGGGHWLADRSSHVP